MSEREREAISNTRAADWLQRREFWNWSEADQAALDAWLDESLAHRVAYHRLEAAWQRTDRLAALRGYRHEEIASGDAGRLFLRAAAAFIAVAVIGAAAAIYTWQPKAKSYSTATGERETLSLSDGSQIELNTNTSLRARMTTGAERQVWLDKGEAYFQVKHDPGASLHRVGGANSASPTSARNSSCATSRTGSNCR